MIDKFMEVYTVELYKAVRQFPQDYSFTENSVKYVVERMRTAIIKGTYNKDSRAIKNTCKRLGIKHTYTAINDYITSTGE